MALRAGINPKTVSTRLGHATVAFTLDTYTADVPDLDRAAAAEQISGLFLPRPLPEVKLPSIEKVEMHTSPDSRHDPADVPRTSPPAAPVPYPEPTAGDSHLSRAFFARTHP
jgi:hypothetical protein